MVELTGWFWSHEYWLPPGVTWEDLRETEDVHYPQARHLLLSLPVTLLLVTLRFFFERHIGVPLSKKMGLREKVQQKAPPNAVLEAFYTTYRKSPQKDQLSGLAKQCDLQPRQVERWFRYRRNQDRPSLTKKFCESSWRATLSLTSFCVGLGILYDKPWFWDHRECWVGYPQQPLLPSIFGYYLLQLSYYIYLLLMLPFDIKRTDYHEQILHHFATIILIIFSYCTNYVRIGSLILIIHKVSPWLQHITKMFIYLKWHKASNVLFLIFSATYLLCHLAIYPYSIIYMVYYFTEFFQIYFTVSFLYTFLITLQLFHIFWACLIVRMGYRLWTSGLVRKDPRSDSEESEKGNDQTG